MMGQPGKPGCIDCVDGICDMNCGPANVPDLMGALRKRLAGGEEAERRANIVANRKARKAARKETRQRELTQRELKAMQEALANRLADIIPDNMRREDYETALAKINARIK